MRGCMKRVGKKICTIKYKRGVMLDPQSIADTLLDPDRECIMTLDGNGKTSNGYKFTQVTIYSKAIESEEG